MELTDREKGLVVSSIAAAFTDLLGADDAALAQLKAISLYSSHVEALTGERGAEMQERATQIAKNWEVEVAKAKKAAETYGVGEDERGKTEEAPHE